MKRFAAVAIVALVAACAEAPSPAARITGDAAMARGGDGVVVASGSGHLTATGDDTDWRTFSFVVRKTADGVVDGQFQTQARQNDPDNHLKGVIECVSVVGNQAWMVGRVTMSTSPNSPVGSYTRFRVVDNGEGANSPSDQISLIGVGFVNPPPYCVNRPQVPALFDIEAGNIQVR